MYITALLAKRLGNGAKKGGDIVVGDADVLVDPFDIEAGVAANLGGSFVWDLAEFGPGFDGRDLYIEPALELVLVAPDCCHLRARVTGDHCVMVQGAGNTEQGTRPRRATLR